MWNCKFKLKIILFLIKMLFIWMITKHNFLKRVYILLFSIHVYKNN